MSKEEFEGRLRRIRNSMKEQGFDALLVYSRPQEWFYPHGHIRYISNYPIGWGPALIILTGKSSPTLLISASPDVASFELRKAKEVSWIQDIRVKEEKQFADEAKIILGDRDFSKGAIGAAGMYEMPARIYEDLKKRFLDYGLRDATNIMADLRMVKSPQEIELVRESASLGDLAFETLIEIAKPGMWEYEVTASIEHALKSKGAEKVTFSFESGPYTIGGLRIPPTRRRLKNEDLIIMAVQVCYKGYWTQTIRTCVIGRPSQKQERVFNTVCEATDAAMKAMKPGAKISEISIASEHVLTQAGYGKNVIGRLGHGLGLDYSEKPKTDVPEDKTVRLKAGNVMVIHSIVQVPRYAGAGIGDMLLITDSGAEKLTMTERGLLTI
jgi:Xaa-Pro dipeptidase